MANSGTPNIQFLAPPAVTALRQEARSIDPKFPPMMRSLSDDMREEREDLKQAAEQTLNVIVDLDLEGRIKWVSPSWKQVIGTSPDSVEGRLISDILVDNKNAFRDAIESMKEDDSRSRFIRFSVCMGPYSSMKPLPESLPVAPESRINVGVAEDDLGVPPEAPEGDHRDILNMEAQGIMVFDRLADGDSHTMWMLRPFTEPKEVTIDLPPLLMESLGVGAEVLANYLTTLADAAANEPDPSKHPAPTPILCRICERQITPWWFEKHSDLCLQEHRAEMDVQIAQENLNEHRNAIVKVLDALEARQSRTPAGDKSPILGPRPEYKGLPIGPSPVSSAPSSGAVSSSSSTLGTPPRSRDQSLSGIGHARGRSFAVRRPLTRIVELILDLCDTALEINMPVIKDSRLDNGDDFRTLSPQSESRISQVLQWQSPSSNTLEQEQGLAVLSADTEQVAKAKVDMVYRHRQIIEYAERIRIEYTVMVEECITAALSKAERIAAGQLSDSSSEDDAPKGPKSGPPQHWSHEPPASISALTMSMRNSPESLQSPSGERRAPSAAVSTGSNSPMECPTPRSHKSAAGLLGTSQPSRRTHPLADMDAGEISDSSVLSSAFHGAVRTDSPSSERSFEKKRMSLVLPGLSSSPRRQHSPARLSGPHSPLRMPKPRLSGGTDSLPSPMASPSTTGGELAYSHHRHHRRRSSATSSDITRPPVSPRMTSVSQPQPRPAPPSIKDFEVIKPISKGAFGSVYLSKKKATGEYFAIKVLKKADMVAKNQVTNVKAERAIMMWQGESDFVAKLYWTFSSKDYLYLVMEYLNGGDCASLVKVLGGLPEDWAKKYIAEVVLGVQHMHDKGIVHRDLKPDNLLIDQAGHLKLTDFGLSRMGLVGRQKRVLKNPNEPAPDLLKQGPFPRAAPSLTSSRSASFDFQGNCSPGSTPLMTADTAGSMTQPSYFSLNQAGLSRQSSRRASGYRSDSFGSDTLSTPFRPLSASEANEAPTGGLAEEEAQSEPGESPYLLPLQPSSSSLTSYGTPQQQQPMMPPLMALFDPEDHNRRFVGTPDYLAPETINGVGQDEMSDWWSLGCIMFEFLFGYPPFNSSTPDEVFERILSRRINWPDDPEDLASPEAIDLMNKLMTMNPRERLGANADEKYENGGAEIRSHPWFSDINWDTLLEDKAQFVPNLGNPEDTDYFDSRGATLQAFDEESEEDTYPLQTVSTTGADRPHDALFKVRSQGSSVKRPLMPLSIPPHVRDSRSRRLSEPALADDFGNFNFKNLPMLEKANKDVIQKLRQEAMQSQQRQITPATVQGPGGPSPSGPAQEGSPVSKSIHRTMSQNRGHNRPSSPCSLSQASASPSRPSQPSSPLLVQFSTGHNHERRKTSGSSSNNSHQSSGSFPPPNADQGRMANLKFASTASSPIKTTRGTQSPDKTFPSQRPGGGSTTRTRSQTIGSQDGDVSFVPSHYKRRSQLFDVSPSSSDNEDPRAKALLKVQRRRQSSRRLSQINVLEGPFFRPLDVLICEDHPISRLVMERLFEKLRCRTISAVDGTEAMQYALSEVQFDVIMTEFKLPHVNGADFARMVRETRSTNRHTPIIAVTSYLKDLPENHPFDSLIEKPPTLSKLTEELCKFCQWKPPPKDYNPNQLPQIPPSSLRHNPLHAEESPSSASSGFAHMPPSLYRGSSRQDSIGSSNFGDIDSIKTDDMPVIISRHSDECGDAQGGLGISDDSTASQVAMQPKSSSPTMPFPYLLHTTSAPPTVSPVTVSPRKQRSSEAIRAKKESLERKRHECGESGDDEDEELGPIQPRTRSPQSSRPCRAGSKLGIEMMRTNSRGSVVSGSEEVLRKERETLEKIQGSDFGGSIGPVEDPPVSPDSTGLEDKFEDLKIRIDSIAESAKKEVSSKHSPVLKEWESGASSSSPSRPAIYQRDTEIFSPTISQEPTDKSGDLDKGQSTPPSTAPAGDRLDPGMASPTTPAAKMYGPDGASTTPDSEATPRPLQSPMLDPDSEDTPRQGDKGRSHSVA